MIRTAAFLCVLSLLTTNARADAEGTSSAAEFRVQIRVHELGAENDHQPHSDDASVISEHQVLFRHGVAYDLTRVPQNRTRFITVFDAAQNRVVLLDRQSKVRSTVSTDNLIELTAKARAATQDPARREALGLMAVAQADESGEQYRIQFGRVTYETETQRPTAASIARTFGGFSDWAARLNIARKVRAPPPFARMTLNQTLAIGGQMPETMIVTIRQDSGETRFQIEHELTEMLAEAERKQIQEIQGMLVAFREVPFHSFPE